MHTAAQIRPRDEFSVNNVIMHKNYSERHGLMLLWFTDLMM